MLALKGIYENGIIKLEKPPQSDKPIMVIVTFLEEEESKEEKPLSLEDFSFMKTRALLADYKGSLSDAVIEERREAL